MPPNIIENGQFSAKKERPALQPMKRIELFLPATRNSGKAVPASDLCIIQKHAMHAFGGYTLHLNLRGGWLDAQHLPFRDAILKIEIEAVDNPQLVLAVMALASLIRQRLAQQAVFVTIEDVGVFYV
ncbi:MAG: hypothetical protein IT329_24380 [Caldilineaceae bacterium]|nr:hypothetical protein [Caldilineaceae bacterium]